MIKLLASKVRATISITPRKQLYMAAFHEQEDKGKRKETTTNLKVDNGGYECKDVIIIVQGAFILVQALIIVVLACKLM